MYHFNVLSIFIIMLCYIYITFIPKSVETLLKRHLIFDVDCKTKT